MELWTALMLGLVGSVHCAGMCGPLLIAVAAARERQSSLGLGNLIYHAGRLATYAAIGAASGAIGKTLAVAGFQRWFSISAGVVILAGLIFSRRLPLNSPAWSVVSRLKGAFAGLLRQRNAAGTFCLGAINGLLPCGLVYVAAVAAMATGGIWSGMAAMVAFGVGTLPITVGIGWAGRRLQSLFGSRVRILIPASIAVMGVLLVLRGLALGIPYVSPDLSSAAVACH